MKCEYLEQVESTRNELKDIKKWINTGSNKFDSKTKHLISYCVVKASGTIEVIYKHILYDYLVEQAKPETNNYLEKMILDSSSNPNTGNIINMLQNISSKWKSDFERDVQPPEKSDLNSLVQLRNDFSHGSNLSTSIESVLKFFESGVKVLKILDKIVV